MGVGRDGTAFVAAAEAIDFSGELPAVDVMRSTDGGRRWTVVSPKAGDANVHAHTGDPYVFVDNHGEGSRVFTVDLQAYVCSLLSFSDDNGETWITNPLGCGRPYSDHQTVFSAPPVSSTTVAYPNVIYYCFQDVISSSCTKSLDGGVSFVPAGSVSFLGVEEGTNELCGGLHGHGFGHSDGSIYIPKVHCGKPWLAISRDEGATWERHQVSDLDGAGHEASVAVDAEGNIYYTYISKALLPYLVVSRDDGKSWSKPMMVGSPGVAEASLPSLDVGPSGEVAVAYMGSENPDGKHSYEQTWNGYITQSSNAAGPNPTFVSVQVNPDNDPLLRGDCAQTKCGPVWDFIDVVIDRRGDAWGAFVDGCVRVCASTPIDNDAAEGLVARLRL